MVYKVDKMFNYGKYYTYKNIKSIAEKLDLFSARLKVDANVPYTASFNRTDYLTVFEQRFSKGQAEIDILNNDQFWTRSIPHEYSGSCDTYDPPWKSDPGYEISMFFTLKDLNASLDIFLHDRDKFFYSRNQMYGKFTRHLDLNEVKKTKNQHTRIIGIYSYS